MNNYTKYGLIFLGGVALGALGAMAISRGRVQGVKPLVAGGIALRDKLMSVAEGVKEDIEDVVAEAQLKNQEKKAAQEAQETAQAVQDSVVEKTPA